MKDNIYDLTVSELILRLDASTANSINTAKVVISSTIGADTVPENFNGAAVFTSEVLNLPSSWSIVGSTHVMSYPVTPVTSGSTPIIVGPSTPVILGVVGSTFIVNSTVDITDGSTTITLTGSLTITSVLPIFYGVKAAPVSPIPPDSTGLQEVSSSLVNFSMITSGLGRIYVAIPTATNGASFQGIIGPNGLLIPLMDFDTAVVGSYNYYYTNYDTTLTGTNVKTFTIMYL